MAKDVPIYKRGDSYYVRVPLGGGKYRRESLGKISNKEAIEKAERILGAQGKDALFDDVAERWLRESVSKQKPGTRMVYKSAMISFSDWFEGLKLSEIDRGVISRWEKDARSSGATNSTLRTYLAALSSLYRWCVEADVADIQNPVVQYVVRAKARQDGSALKRSDPRTRHLSEDEEDRLLAAADPIPMLRAAIAIAIGLNGSSITPSVWSGVTMPLDEVGDAWPLVRP